MLVGFGKVRTRFWTTCRHSRIAGLTTATREPIRHKRPQSVCAELMADLIQAYQDWAKGAFERIMADGLSCQRQIIATTGALTSPPIAPSVTERVGDHTRPEAKAPARSKST